MPEHVRDAGHERRLGADHDEVDVDAVRTSSSRPSAVVGANRVAAAERRDARVARRGVQLVEPRALRELPGERVLAPARADDEDVHAGRVYG